MTHDFRHHIAALSGMLQGGETQQAQDYLAALQEQLTERALMVNTHNSAIDAVLNQKGYAAQKQHIDIQFEVNDLSPLQIELIDCTVVLGNLLDNAIEACLKLEEAKRRIESAFAGRSLRGRRCEAVCLDYQHQPAGPHRKGLYCHNEIGTASARLWSALCQRAAAPQQRLLHDGLS